MQISGNIALMPPILDFLDDAADLVTCPTGHPAAADLVAETNATLVTQTNSFTLYSVPRR
jgi:hypothetical protein